MPRLPLNIQTLLADLTQSLEDEEVMAASVHVRTVAGNKYLYVRERKGLAFSSRSLGPVGDPEAESEASRMRHAGARARVRRKLVTLIRNAGVPAPSGDMARVIEAISAAGLFRKGVVLVGTGAFQIYSALVGSALGALQTQDVDLAVATLAIKSDISMLDLLRQADASFERILGLGRGDPAKRFVTRAGFAVEILTPVRTGADVDKVAVRGLSAAATPLPFLDYLLADAMPAVALISSGVWVTVPQPARYAVHKLIVAQRRPAFSHKKAKDLAQARELIEAMAHADPHAIADALEEARERGPTWQQLIEASLGEIGADAEGRLGNG